MEEWIEVKLGSLFEVNVGGDLRTEYFSLKADELNKFPIYSNSLDKNGLYGFTSKPRHPANSITITGRGFLGHAEYRDIDFDAIVRLLVLTPKQDVDCRFITYLINGRINFAIESTGVPQLTAPKIVKTKVVIPERVAEQTAIATLLSKVDEAIAATQNSIKVAEKLKKALMQNLLTGKLKPDGSWRTEDEFYEDEKFGKVPKGWEVKKLKDVFFVNQNSLPSQTDGNFTFRYITIEAVQTENIDFASCPEYAFKDSPGRARRIINDNDILISGVRPNLKAFAIYQKPNDENWICSTGFYVLTAKDEENHKYHFYQILSEIGESQFHSYVAGSNYPAIGDRDLKLLKLLRPPYDEQCLIEEKISSISIENSKKQTKIQTLQRLKKSLMQNLLTGKLRLPQEFIAQFEEVEETIKS